MGYTTISIRNETKEKIYELYNRLGGKLFFNSFLEFFDYFVSFALKDDSFKKRLLKERFNEVPPETINYLKELMGVNQVDNNIQSETPVQEETVSPPPLPISEEVREVIAEFEGFEDKEI